MSSRAQSGRYTGQTSRPQSRREYFEEDDEDEDDEEYVVHEWINRHRQ
jgi:hypothetical protein